MFLCVCVFFLNVYEILPSCHCIICTIVTLNFRSRCVEVNYTAFLKAAHSIVFKLLTCNYFALKRTRRMVENV